MDWHAEDASWTSRDFGIFGFEQRYTVALRKLESNPTLIKDELEDKQEWDDWLFELDTPNTTITGSQLHIVLCSRAPPVFDGTDAPAWYVSVTRDTWERLTRKLHIHREIRRPISRGVDYFTSHYETGKEGEPKIYFIARMSSSLPGDLALSLTYVPSKDTTFAVVYGCHKDQIDDIEKRIEGAGDKIKYPLLLVGLLVELERERTLAEAEKLVDAFTLRSDYFDSESTEIAADISNEQTQKYVSLCFKARFLMDHIKAVEHQLSKLVVDLDKFNKNKNTRRFNRSGKLMKKRVKDIIDEYNVKINECQMIIEETSLATQTAYNQIAKMDSEVNKEMTRTNTDIARETKQEGTQMRSIALLTMIYLPFSSVAAIFSMDMFDWSPQTGGSVVSKYIWVFAAFAIGLTGITFYAWHLITSRHSQASGSDISGQHGKIV
ncbi:hypothetical protein F4806DRAFT_224156 [Annulohypoxylon nitens]|nr:hypothetical protein F4806DRAFT_224156 [Annulohypoxylon nitens]